MAILARPAATAAGKRLGPAIPTGFGAVMKWLADNADDENCPWCGAAHGMAEGVSRRRTRSLSQRGLIAAAQKGKSKRRVSPYQREFGRQLKKLKKKHPRTPVQRLMKRAHTATKKARRGK